MPVSFQKDWLLPMLKAIQAKEFPRWQEYSTKFVDLYADAVSKGFPQGIPPTLPSPTAVGVTVPVGTGAADSLKDPYIMASSERMKRVIFAFYTTRDEILKSGDIEAKKQILKNAIRKAQYQTKLLQNSVKRVESLTKQLKDLPINIKAAIEGVKLMVELYLGQLQKVKADILGFSPTEGLNERLEQFRDDEGNLKSIDDLFFEKFPDEAALIDKLKNLNFTDIPGTANTFREVGAFIKNQKAFGYGGEFNFGDLDQDRERAIGKQQLQKILANFATLASGILAPESLGALFLKIKGDVQLRSEKVNRKLDKAIIASDQVLLLKVFVQPELEKLQTFIKKKKKKIEDDLDKTKESVQESIDTRARELAETKAGVKIKKDSEFSKWYKKKAEDAKQLKEDVDRVVVKNAKRFKLATNIITKTVDLLNAALAVEKEIEDAVLADFKKIKEEKEKLNKIQEGFEGLKTPTPVNVPNLPITNEQLNTILTEYRLDLFKKVPGLLKLIRESNLSVDELKKKLLATEEKYTKLYKKILGIETNVKQLKDAFNELKESFSNPNKEIKEPKPPREKKRKPKERNTEKNISIKKILDKIVGVLDDIDGFRVKCQQNLKEWATKQKEFLDKKKDAIETALYASIPLPVEVTSEKTKKEVAKEKKQALEQYQVKLKQIKKIGTAVKQITTNAGKVASNIGKGDYSSGSNEVPLKEIGKGRFNAFTATADPASSKWQTEYNRLQIWNKEIDTLKEIESYYSIFKTVLEEVKSVNNQIQEKIKDRESREQTAEELTNVAKEKLDGIVAELKSDYEAIVGGAQQSIANFNERGVPGVSPIINELLRNLDELFKSDFSDPNALFRQINTIQNIASSNILSETLQSQPVVQAFQNIEQKYLTKTKIVLEKIIGAIPQEQIAAADEGNAAEQNEALASLLQISVAEVEAERNQQKELVKVGEQYQLIKKPKSSPPPPENMLLGPLAKSNRFAKTQVQQAKKDALNKIGNSKLYKNLVKAHQALANKKGSLIILLINMLLELLNKFERFVKNQVTGLVIYIKKFLQKKIDDNKEALENAFNRIKERLGLVDIIATAAMLQIAVQAFWIGATWTNSVGTTFQVLFTKPGKIVRVNSKVDEAGYYKAISNSFQGQMSGVQGIAIPNPASGIPPFFWKGYA